MQQDDREKKVLTADRQDAKCPFCDGDGSNVANIANGQHSKTCEACNGTGKIDRQYQTKG